MPRAPDLESARRHFADELRAVSHLGDERLVEAFARVPRERFAGPGPWRLHHWSDGYWSTPDAEPHWLYHNVLIALDESRGLNVGSPALWAFFFDRLAIRAGQRVLQVGAGSGYYSAILAELVGPTGRIEALEIDRPLAAAARLNLQDRPWVRVRAADANRPRRGRWDLIAGFAGITEPAAWWLDSLAAAGRLVVPMTAGDRGGFMLRVDRVPTGFAARSLGTIGFYPCQSGRTPDAEQALAAALAAGGAQEIRSLRRDSHAPGAACWLHRPGWCLSRQEVG